LTKKIEKNDNREHDSKIIKIEVEAIETPRGLVPTISSVNSIVQALNKVLESITKMITEIVEELRKNTEAMERVANSIRSLDAKMDVLQSLLTEIKINMERNTTDSNTKKFAENRKRDVKKDLFNLLKE